MYWGEAAVEMRGAGLGTRDVHRVTAAGAARLPTDRAAAAAARYGGRRAGLHVSPGGPVAARVVTGGQRRVHRPGGAVAGGTAGGAGIDERRRGRADEAAREHALLAGRWHTCFFELSGYQGLLGQVEGRTADDAAYWLWQVGHEWRDAVRLL